MERNVKFNFEPDEVIMGSLLLEGEKHNDECLTDNESELHQGTHQDEELITIEPKNHHISIEISQMRKDSSTHDDETIVEDGGRGKCIQKETQYMKMLREGSGVTGARGGVLPKGMQHGTVAVNDDEPEIDQAMVTVIENVEGLMPLYAEARRHPDWPKREEAIKKELKGLESSGTW